MKRQQIQKQERLTAYNRKTTHDIFFMTMEWLEKYIEIAGYYPDWENRKQIHNNNVKRLDIIGNPKKTEQDFLTQLFLFWGTLKRNLPFSDELKAEFYQWLNATKIDNNNCPIRLKHLLYGFNEVLEGRGEKLQEDIENMEEELDSNSPEYMEQIGKIFVNIQAPLRDEAEVEKSLKGKSHKDIEIGKKFSGDGKMGEKIFSRLTGSVSSNDFSFFKRKGQLNNPQQITNSEIIQDVKQNPRNWRFDEVITGYDNRGRATKKETALIHNSAEVGFDGAVSDAQQPVYLAQRFNEAEIIEINQALGISQTPNYDNWTKEQFIAEINLLKAENEWLKNNQVLTSSEKQERLQQNQQKLQKLQKLQSYNVDSQPNNSKLSTNLAIGGTLLAVIGLISFLVIRKHKKNK